MENCLVKKLKGTVNNDSLKYFGKMIWKFHFTEPNSNMSVIRVEASEDLILTIKGDATWTTGDSSLVYIDSKTIKLPANTIETIYATTDNKASGDFMILCDKYHLTSINNLKGIENYKTEDFAYCTELIMLGGSNTTVMSGDIANFSELTLLETIALNNDNNTYELFGDISVLSNCHNMITLSIAKHSSLYGNISALNELINLESIALRGGTQGNHIEGNLNSLLDSLHSAGKRGRLSVDLRESDVTYTGVKNVQTQVIGFTFDNNGWTEN